MINDITVIIVSYKSQITILNCIKSIKRFNKILILDNSNDKKLKNYIKKKIFKNTFFFVKKKYWIWGRLQFSFKES